MYIYVSLRPLIPPPRLNKVDPNWAVRGVHTDVIQRIRLNSSTIWFFAGVGVIFCHAWHMLIGKQTCWFTIRVFIRERKKQIPNLNPHASSIVDLTFGIKGMGDWFSQVANFWFNLSYFFPFGLVVPISTSFPTESRSFSITASVKSSGHTTHHFQLYTTTPNRRRRRYVLFSVPQNGMRAKYSLFFLSSEPTCMRAVCLSRLRLVSPSWMRGFRRNIEGNES
jgi:hypothetical protein